jgi:hypothetical protein
MDKHPFDIVRGSRTSVTSQMRGLTGDPRKVALKKAIYSVIGRS